MKCKRCGNTVLPNQVFCNKCGAPITEEDSKKSALFDDEDTSTGKIPHFKLIIAIIAALVIILIIVLLIMNGKNKKGNSGGNVAENSGSYLIVVDDYNLRIPENYSQGMSDDTLYIYNENDKDIGAISIYNESYSKLVNTKGQALEKDIKANHDEGIYTLVSKETKNINGLDCTVYEIKITDKSNSENNLFFYAAIVKINDTTTATVASYVAKDTATSYGYLENLVKIVATVEKRESNTTSTVKNNTTNATNTVNNTTNTTTKNTTNTVNNITNTAKNTTVNTVKNTNTVVKNSN